MSLLRTLAIASIATFIAGCGANTYMAGSRLSDHPPGNPAAVYTSSICVNLADGSTVPTPGLKYYVEPGGAAIHEFDSNNAGARIFNTWTEPDGQHYFMWVRTAHGYEIVVPKDGEVATRYIYLKGTFKAYKEGGVLKVRGTRALMCPLSKVK